MEANGTGKQQQAWVNIENVNNGVLAEHKRRSMCVDMCWKDVIWLCLTMTYNAAQETTLGGTAFQ
jgi:hypothetical protein